jgi:hypothetical protein
MKVLLTAKKDEDIREGEVEIKHASIEDLSKIFGRHGWQIVAFDPVYPVDENTKILQLGTEK